MRTISKAFAERLIDYAPAHWQHGSGFAESQLDGAVAAYNMLARNRVAYLADEVGMGKTYVALGVLGLMRHAHPNDRAMIIAPRENIQRKWVKELTNFVGRNWLIEDNRFRNLQSGPARPTAVCNRFGELALALMHHAKCDPFLRMTTFSVALKERKRRGRYAEEISRHAPWLRERLDPRLPPDEFLVELGFAINALLPKLDLLIIDEAHNLRHGFGSRVSNRNRLLAIALGHEDPGRTTPPWYEKKAERVLLLSATPFECDYADLQRQLDVLGHGCARLRAADDSKPLPVASLAKQDILEEVRRETVSRLMIRRVGHMNIAGKKHSKNMYRREWRRGGYLSHDEPMAITDDRQRLIVALIQKKVTELLGEDRFQNRFQIGMLSSFESFLESLARKRRTNAIVNETDDEDPQAGFDMADQTEDIDERRGVDTGHIAAVASSYREHFDESLPHPKLDATCDALRDAFTTGEKALLFMRRVATVDELAAKLNRAFDEWIRERMLAALPRMADKIARLFDHYRSERRRIAGDHAAEVIDEDRDDEAKFLNRLPEDESGHDSFFAWFFRGTGPKGVLSGAAMQRNRFGSASSILSTFFEEDYVAWLLGRPKDTLASLGERLNVDQAEFIRTLRRRAFAYYEQRTRQKEGYPRLYVYESYQAAALTLLASLDDETSRQAFVILDERFDGWAANEAEPTEGFPLPDAGLGIMTFVTELQRRSGLRESIWPDEDRAGFRDRFRRREQRRELLSSMCRLGAAYIDLYLTAIEQIGSLESGRSAESDAPPDRLANAFLDRLESQRKEGGFGAYYELVAAATSFDTILSVNFPELAAKPLKEAADLFSRTLSEQTPVAGMSGGVKKRLVSQFRMPGFPLILASTDVLQEGEDLHTFCRRVIHYGIAWTPSALEQRTGRVDRIGGLAQRELEGRVEQPDDHEFIQVHYPHLLDTIEVLQVRRVLARVNEFLRLSHDDISVTRTYDSRLDLSREFLRTPVEIPRIEGLLRSAFDNTGDWLEGELGLEHVRIPPIEKFEQRLASAWDRLERELILQHVRRRTPREYRAAALVNDGALVCHGNPAPTAPRRQAFTLTLSSQFAHEETLIRCTSPVGRLDLDDPSTLDRLYDLQKQLHDARICIHPETKSGQYHVEIREERLIHLTATQHEEIRDLVECAVVAADTIEQEILATDAPVVATVEEAPA